MTGVGTTCPKCSGAMERGYIVDISVSARVVSQWAAGEPRKDFFNVTKWPEDGFVPVGTFRCVGCGFLESFAGPEFAAK
jgi:hypothetical protein